MHPAPIGNLPIHPTPAVARQESHGDDFTVHLREEVRENTRYDEPRRPQHDKPNSSEARPRAPEEDHQRLSPDDGGASVEQPESSEKPNAWQKQTELPDSDTEATNAVAPLGRPEPAKPEPAADTAETETIPAQFSTLSVSTASGLGLVIDGDIEAPTGGKADIAALASAPTAPAVDGEPDLPIAKAPPTAAATDTPAQTTIPAASLAPTTPVPAESNLAGQTAAATIVAAGGVRGGSGSQSQTGGDTTSTDSLTTGRNQAGEDNGELEMSPGSAKKQTAEIAGALQAGQSAGATAKPPVTTEAGIKEMPALQDIAARGNDMTPQTNTHGANQNSATAFGSELKLAGNTSFAATASAARNTPNAVASQVAVQINRAVQDGQDKFVIDLKPGTLGKISVQLEVGHDNRIIAVIAAERPETLELLQRDSRALELALKEAGLKTDSDSLSFSLQGDGAEDSPFDDPSGSNHAIAVPQDGDDLDTLPTQNTHTYATDASGVDIHV